MREMKYLSYTSLSAFYSNLDDFFIRYLSDVRLPRSGQTQAMAAGSAFDAYVKSHLYEHLFGKVDPKYELTAIFEQQVEAHNREEAWAAGNILFHKYKRSGAYIDLLTDLQQAASEPKFEIEVSTTITTPNGSVPLLGKPDIFYISKSGTHVILDFKVNGYYSRNKVNPGKGYVKLWRGTANYGSYKDAFISDYGGMKINAGFFFEDLNKEWAAQTTMYAWLCGLDIGEQFISAVDQLIHQNAELQVAAHRAKVSPVFQKSLFERAVRAWNAISSNHLFQNLSKEESDKRCQLLEDSAKTLLGDGPNDEWFAKAVR
jgi:hypothetical protein